MLQICSTCALVTRKQTVTIPVPELIEMAIKDGHYGILEMLGNIIHYVVFLIYAPKKHIDMIFLQKYNFFQMP